MSALNSVDTHCRLTRPGVAENSPLQAWDAADEYLIKTIRDINPASLCILNDGFGALACHLHNFAPLWVSDSACAHDALQLNLTQNNLPALQHCNTSELPGAEFSCVIVKARRGLTALRQDLQIAASLAGKQGQVFLAGMAKHIAPGTLEILRELGELELYPTLKKARLYRLSNLHKNTPLKPEITPIRDTVFYGFAGVFATNRIDEGTALLLTHLPPIKADARYADLCCGTGIIGLSLLQKGATQVDFSDEYKPALNNTEYNLRQLQGAMQTNCFWQDGMQHAAPQSYDAIFCNPPFHEQNVVTEHIALRLFVQARNSLKPGASLYVVCNRHLNYLPRLKQLFKSAHIISQHPKFMVIKADLA